MREITAPPALVAQAEVDLKALAKAAGSGQIALPSGQDAGEG